MGACTFQSVGCGKTAKEAFTGLREIALHEYGHRGYSGTIAEKDSFIEVTVAKSIIEDRAALQAKIDELTNTQFDDKWGPAGCIKIDADKYVFFGWASE